jgi:hypothetical protein
MLPPVDRIWHLIFTMGMFRIVNILVVPPRGRNCPGFGEYGVGNIIYFHSKLNLKVGCATVVQW